MDYSELPLSKGKTRTQVKSQRARLEAKVKRIVRKAVAERDGRCLVMRASGEPATWCEGPSEWAHFSGHRRSQTRGLPPERRHSTLFSGMLCRRHHMQEERGQYRVVYQTADYADGPVGWERVA